MYYYGSDQETDDLNYLKTVSSQIVNPNTPKYQRERGMRVFLQLVSECSAIWYRGDSKGVIIEVLSALAIGKPVYSLKSRKRISNQEKSRFKYFFQYQRYYLQDIAEIKDIFSNKIKNRYLLSIEDD